MKNILARFMKDDSGATAIEYGLIAAGISVAIIAVVQRPRLDAEHQVHQHLDPAQVAGRKSDLEGLRRLRRSLLGFGRKTTGAVYER